MWLVTEDCAVAFCKVSQSVVKRSRTPLLLCSSDLQFCSINVLSSVCRMYSNADTNVDAPQKADLGKHLAVIWP